MSILFTDAWSVPPVQAVDPTPLPQSSSSPTPRRGRWWSGLFWQGDRVALRDIADNPHLLNDVGLTREEALREAAKPFWRR